MDDNIVHDRVRLEFQYNKSSIQRHNNTDYVFQI